MRDARQIVPRSTARLLALMFSALQFGLALLLAVEVSRIPAVDLGHG
jgi:hypothetical protein